MEKVIRDISKRKLVKFKLDNGITREVEFYPVIVIRKDMSGTYTSIDEGPEACTRCPYGTKVCSFSKFPDNMEEESLRGMTFHEFCSNYIEFERLTSSLEEFDIIFASYVPVPGSLDKFPELVNKSFKGIAASDTVVSIGSVIDTFCKDTCSYYRPDYSECSNNLGMCILHDILKVEKEKSDKITNYGSNISET